VTVKYCLAEPVDRVCHVGLSSGLLLGVTICVLIKTVVAIVASVVLCRQSHPPLVTLGDAIASFITRPDPNTVGMCTIGQREARASNKSAGGFILAGPKQWRAVPQRRWNVVPKSVWLSSYALFISSLLVVAVLFGFAYKMMALLVSLIISRSKYY
jgi:hypothetical protein